MMDDEAGERTEAPTARRRQEARESGHVARSVELTAAVTLLGALAVLNSTGRDMFGRMLSLTRGLGDAPPECAGDLKQAALLSVRAAAEMLYPFLLCLLIVPLLASLGQVGWIPTPGKLIPNLGKLSPMQGVRRLFSMDSATQLATSVVKAGLVTSVVYVTLRDRLLQVLGTGGLSAAGVLAVAADAIYTLALRVALLLLVMGVIDYLYQRWKLERSLRMTKQEVKDEMKRMEGDPLIRQRRRQVQLKLAMQRIALDVPKADVVVTNPTEYAVAIRYDESTMRAPKILAKGKDLLAARIRQVAGASGVPIVQRPPLARALYAACEPGDEVPPAYYRAVAELLAFVYRLVGAAERRRRAAAVMS